MGRQAYRHSDGWTDRHTDTQMDGQIGKGMDGGMDGWQTGRSKARLDDLEKFIQRLAGQIVRLDQ